MDENEKLEHSKAGIASLVTAGINLLILIVPGIGLGMHGFLSIAGITLAILGLSESGTKKNLAVLGLLINILLPVLWFILVIGMLSSI